MISIFEAKFIILTNKQTLCILSYFTKENKINNNMRFYKFRLR